MQPLSTVCWRDPVDRPHAMGEILMRHATKTGAGRGLLLALAAPGMVLACGQGRNTDLQQEVAVSIRVESSAFAAGGAIPMKYTCDGQNVSPPLAWSGVPAEARSLALIVDDPDAPRGTFVHWVAYAIPVTAVGLAEGQLPAGALAGRNDARRSGYSGPCPPPGAPHHYHFKVYALDQAPEVGEGATKADLLRAMEGHVVAQGELVATYKRR